MSLLKWWASYDVENDSLVLQVDSTGFDEELILPPKLAIDSMSADSCWIETLSTKIKVPVGGGDGDPGVYAARGDTALDTLGFSMTFGPARRAGKRPECEGANGKKIARKGPVQSHPASLSTARVSAEASSFSDVEGKRR